jgi:opacity protein-like surface antigen
MFCLVSNLLLLSYPAHSQIKLGIQLGANSANVKVTNNIFEFDNTTHFMGGVLAEFKISNMFYIQPEFNYLPKGVMGNSNMYYARKADYTFNYYEIPINVLAKFDTGDFTPFLFAGPSLSFLSKATLKIDDHPAFGEEANISKDLKKTDFSINFGAGVELNLSNSIDLFIIARYSLGIIDIPIDSYGEFKTRGIAITAGLKFGI